MNRLIVLAHIFLFASFSIADTSRKGLGEECYKIIHSTEPQDPDRVKECKDRFLTIVVSATKTEKQVALAPSSVSLISRKSIERGGKDSIAEILRDIPGVSISDAGEPGLKHLRIRGEESRRCAILIDGQEFSDQREVGTPILISTSQIERIEVVRGPASVLYGSRAIGGVINIITRKGGYHPAQGSVGTTYDSSAQGMTAHASVFGSIHDFDYRLGVSKSDFENRESAQGEIDNTSYENDSISGYLGKHFDNHLIGFGWDLFNGGSRVYVDPVVATTPPFRNFTIDVPERDREKFSLWYDWKSDSDSLIQKIHADAFSQVGDRGFLTDSETAVTVADSTIITNTNILTQSKLSTFGINLQADATVGEDHSVISGVQLSDESLDQIRTRNLTTMSVPKPAEVVLDEASQERVGLYLQDEWQFDPKWALTLGGRSDWVSSKLDATTRPGLAPSSTDDSKLLGSATLSYSGIEDTIVFGKYTQGFMYPSLVQVGTGAFAGPSYVNPNMDLDPETSDNFEIGMRYSSKPITAEVSLFHTDAEDYIDHVLCSSTDAVCLIPTGARDRVYTNIDEAKTEGVEASLKYKIDAFTPYTTMTWLRRTFERETFETDNTGLPAVTSRVGIEYERPVASEISFWADAFLRMSSDADETEETGSTLHYSGWMTTNLSFGFEFGQAQAVKLGLELRNLGDILYTPATENIASPGRSALLTLSGTF